MKSIHTIDGSGPAPKPSKPKEEPLLGGGAGLCNAKGRPKRQRPTAGKAFWSNEGDDQKYSA